MIVELLGLARRADGFLERRFGGAYHAVLGISVVVEIVHRLREGPHLNSARGVATLLGLVVFCFLLLHLVAELGEHVGRRTRVPQDKPAASVRASAEGSNTSGMA